MTEHLPIQVVDGNDNPTGGASLQEVHDKGLIHRIVMVLVESLQGDILLQLRSAKVWTHPNKWDISAAGHVDEGEDYSAAAKRELQEETGISGYELIKLGITRVEETYEDRILNRFKAIYKTVVPRDIKLKIDPEEVAELRWFTKEQVKELIQDYPDDIIYDFIQVLDKYYL